MDIESHLRRIETAVSHTRTLVWVVLVILIALSLKLAAVIDSGECVVSILFVLALFAVAHLVVSFASGLWRFWTHRGVDAELQEKILRAFIAERAKARNQDPGP